MEIFISKISLNNRRILHFGFLLFVLLFSFEAVADRVSIRAKEVDQQLLIELAFVLRKSMVLAR